MSKHLRQQGFTLVELLITVTLLSVLVSVLYVPQIESDLDRYQQSVAISTAEEIYQLGTAAQSYAADNNGSWPDMANDCVAALSAMQTSGHLPPASVVANPERSPTYREGEITKALPFSVGTQTKRLGQYYTECAESPSGSGMRQYIYIRYAFPKEQEKFAGLVQNQLPAANTISNSDYDSVSMAVPLPGAIPALDALLPRDGSRAMAGELDMANNGIYEAEDVYLANGQSLGATVLHTEIVSAGSKIKKPDCLTGYQPNILVTPADIYHIEGFPITKFRAYAEDATDSWTVKSELVVVGGTAESDKAHHKLAVVIRCVQT